MCSLFITHGENSYHISDNISASRSDIREIKPLLKSYINMLSGMASFVMMLREMSEWNKENEKPLFYLFGRHPVHKFLIAEVFCQ